MGDHPTEEFLREVVREAERVQDQQIESMQAFDGRTQNLIALAATALAAGFALGTYLISSTCGWAEVFLLFGTMAGVVAAIISLIFFFESYTGITKKNLYYVTPEPAQLLVLTDNPNWSLRNHLIALLTGIKADCDRNDEIIEHVYQYRRRGLLSLLAAGSLYGTIGILYLAVALLAGACA